MPKVMSVEQVEELSGASGCRTLRESLFYHLDQLCASHEELRRRLAEATAQGGPISSERWTLDELLVELGKWKDVASGKTCVSFENLCYGASSLWHQTHRENFRKIDRKPEELSRWVLEHDRSVHDNFPEQVIQILRTLKDQTDQMRDVIRRLVETTVPESRSKMSSLEVIAVLEEARKWL